MNRLIGVFSMVAVLALALVALDPNPLELEGLMETAGNIASRLGFYGVMTVGVGVLIVSGGIDLSIGSVVGLGAILFGLMLEDGVSPWLAAPVVVLGGTAIGLLHGVLVTKLRLQPFLVTLCGLFVYRGLARLMAPGAVGLGATVPPATEEFRESVLSFRELMVGVTLGVPNQLLILLLLATLLGLYMHGTVYGRYLFAIGANEDAARYAGVRTDPHKIVAYMICSGLAGLAGVLSQLESRSSNATDAGQLMELYAITGAVLGGCSLRGGEGLVPGMVLGAAVLPLLRELCLTVTDRSELEYVVIGLALLLGTVADEMLKRRTKGRGS